jgi:hypothetical protein
MNKAFGSNVTPRDTRHHHQLSPLWQPVQITSWPPLEWHVRYNLAGWECAVPGCTELFTPNGNVSTAHTARSGTSRFDLPRFSHNHNARRLLAGADAR